MIWMKVKLGLPAPRYLLKAALVLPFAPPPAKARRRLISVWRVPHIAKMRYEAGRIEMPRNHHKSALGNGQTILPFQAGVFDKIKAI